MAQWDTLGFMKILIKFFSIILIGLSLIIFSCSKKNKKPIVTIQKFALQKFQMNEVFIKLLNEKDIKVMNFMADGIESSRAVDCSPVGEECNLYYSFINKVVNVTHDKELSNEDKQILTDIHTKFLSEMKISEHKLKLQWKDYINSQTTTH